MIGSRDICVRTRNYRTAHERVLYRFLSFVYRAFAHRDILLAQSRIVPNESDDTTQTHMPLTERKKEATLAADLSSSTINWSI